MTRRTAPALATEDAAHLFAIGTVVIYNFLAHRHLTFGPGIRHALAEIGRRSNEPPTRPPH